MKKHSILPRFHQSKHFDKPPQARALIGLALMFLFLLVVALSWIFVFRS